MVGTSIFFLMMMVPRSILLEGSTPGTHMCPRTHGGGGGGSNRRPGGAKPKSYAKVLNQGFDDNVGFD